MATIYLKSVASGEQCVILEPREALLYTFDFGDWREIRMGAFFSVTRNGNNNLGYTTAEQDQLNSNTPNDQFYFGFKDQSYNMPYSSGTVFMGYSTRFNTTHILQGNIDYYPYGGVGSQANLVYVSGIEPGNTGLYYFGPMNLSDSNKGFQLAIQNSFVSSNGAYARANGIVIKRGDDKIGTGYFAAYGGNAPVPVGTLNTDFSVLKMRQALSMASLAGVAWDGISGAYFGDELNSAFFYCPHFGFRVRIHALVVERYA